MPAALPFLAAGGQAASGAKGAQSAQQASADSIAQQQQALNLAFPPEIRAGRQNIATGVNNAVGGFFGDSSASDLGGQFTEISTNQEQRQFSDTPTSFDDGRSDFVPERSNRSIRDLIGDAQDPANLGLFGGFLKDKIQGNEVEGNVQALPEIPPELITNFESQGIGQLGRLAELSNVPVDSRIGGLINQQVEGLGGIGEAQTQNLQGFQQQVGNIGEQTQGGLQGLLQLAGGATQDIQSLLNNNNPDAQNQQGIGRFLDVAGNVAENASAQSQFTDPLQETLASTRNLNSQVIQDSQALISANEEQSRFEEDRAITELDDLFANRGLGRSSASIDALTSAKQRFSRDRSQSAARIGAQARQQQFQNQLGALNQQGNLASIGGQLQQQGFNTQLRGASTGGQLLGQGTQNTLGLLNAQRGQTRDIQGILQQLGQSQLGTAGTQFDLQNQINNQGFNTRAQQLGLLQGGEGRAQQNAQQLFSNFGNQLGFLTPFLSQLFGAGQAGGGQAAQISNQIGNQQFQNAINQQRQAGQAFGGAINLASEGFQNQPAPIAQPQQTFNPDFNQVGAGGLSGSSFFPR